MIGCSNKHPDAIEASGTLEATEVRVSAQVPGQIERILFQEGDDVKVGDTLVVLNRSTLELKQALASVSLFDARVRS